MARFRTDQAREARMAELRSKMESITADIEKLGDKPELTPGDEDRYARLRRGYVNAMNEHQSLEDEQRAIALAQERAVNAGRPGSDLVAMPGAPGIDDYGRPRDGMRDQALWQIERSNKVGHLADHAAERATSLVDKLGSAREQSLAARWVTTAGDDAYRSAFAKMIVDPTRGHLLWTDAERDAYQRVALLQSEMRAMSLTDGNGGYMVPMTLDPALNLSNAGSNNPLRRISRVVQTVTDSWTGLNSAGATAEWKAEGVQAADGSPTVDDEPIPVHFGDVFVPYSYEVGMDAVNILDELTRVLVDAADVHQAAAYTTGSGTGQPTGFVTALAGGSSVVASGTADTLAAGDVFNVQNALPARFQARAQWTANLSTINALRQLETTNGALKFPELANGQLLGRPMNECSDMDGVINASQTNHILAYGDFNNFVIVDRIGSTLEVVPNLLGANGRPTGQRGAFLWYRTGSDVLVDNAFRILNA